MSAESESKLNINDVLIILAIGSAALMSSLDSTIVNITLPTLSRYFGVSILTVSWIGISYLLALSGLLLPFGRLGDLLGFKKIFIWGLAVFTIGSFLCAISNSIGVLIVFRIVQGVGGSMILAISPAMVFVFLRENIRGMALGYITATNAVGIALGPIIAGFLTAYLGWRWDFPGQHPLRHRCYPSCQKKAV